MARLAQHDVDKLVALAELPHLRARQKGFGGLRNRLAAHAQRARLGLVHLQAQHFHGLVPVVVHTPHLGALPQQGLDLVGALAQHLRVRTLHTELHGIGHRRAIGQQLDAAPHFRKLLRQQRRQLVAQRLADLQVLRHHDELRHIGLRKHLIERQIKPRHP